jgi:hypothetical protein
MRRRRAGLLTDFILWAALTAPALAQLPGMPQTPEERRFYALVQRAIYHVTPQQQGRFQLGLADRTAPVFNAAGDGIEQVQCEQVANFSIIGFANELGQIGASVCKNGARVREMAMRARDGLAAALKNLPPSSDEQPRKAGLYYSQETLADGAEFFYFPVLLIGHGVLGPVTAVIYDKKTGSAAVVQAALLQMCGEQFGKDFQDSAFCTDPRGALKRVAQAIR